MLNRSAKLANNLQLDLSYTRTYVGTVNSLFSSPQPKVFFFFYFFIIHLGRYAGYTSNEICLLCHGPSILERNIGLLIIFG